MTQFDLPGLFEFLQQTPEQGLRKMFVDGKPMTEPHFNLLIKIVRNCSSQQFCEHVEKGDYPKIKMGPSEQKLKEIFWADCFKTFQSRGILNPAAPKAA